MNNPRRIFKNTIALTVASVGHLIGNVILFFYLSRLLQVEGLGVYATIMGIFQTASIGCGVGFASFIPRELPKDLSQTNRYLVHASLIALVSAMLILVGVDVVVPFLGYLPQTQLGIYIISLAFLPTALLVVLRALFIVYQKSEFITLTALLGIIVRILASLLALYLGASVISLVVIYVVCDYLTLLVVFYFFVRYVFVPHWEFDRTFLFAMLRDLKAFAGLVLLGTLFSQVELVVLSLTKGETQVGFYSAALKLVTIWAMVSDSYMTTVFPVLSLASKESLKKAADIRDKSIKYLWAVAFPLAFGTFVVADMVIPLFYGSGFEQSIDVLRVLAWYLPLNFCNTVLWRTLLARDEQNRVLRGQLVADLFRGLLALILTPQFGALGAAWALISGRLAFLLYNIYYVQRGGLKLPLLKLGWRFAFAAGLMAAGVWSLVGRVSLYLLILLAAVVYALLIFVLRGFSAEDVALFRKIWKREQEPA
ncbi:MAG: flippase [Anaerolineae bacterium]|nr:flippase [Anaerolineae bacterium]